VPLHGVLYVGFVATALVHRRRGLAELVMRRSLEDATRATGITRTVLHATADGYPVYRRMGYRPVDEFSGGVSNVDIDGNNTLQIKSIGVAISTLETLPRRATPPC
jgi:predicted acetyltransferase